MEDKKRIFPDLNQIGPAKVVMLAIAGVILLVTSVPFKRSSGSMEDNTSGLKEVIKEKEENQAYVEQMENKLKQILEHVDGVGQVEVMITLKASGENILNKDILKEETAEEETGEENSKSTYSTKNEEETILADGKGDNVPYVVKKLEPEVAGVLITCEGAGSNQVVAAVTEAAEAVFGIPTSHIKVLKMEAQQ